MTEYYSNREHFERSLPVATFNHEMSEFLTDIIEATKIIKDEQVDHLYVQIGTAELGLEKSYSTFEKSSNRSVDMQTSAQKAHKDIMETIDSKFTLGMDETFNNLNDVNGQNKQYKTQKMSYTKAYEGPGAGGSTYEEHYTLSQLLNYKTSPIKAAREVYNGKVSFVKERIKHQDQMTDEEIKAIKGKNVEELVELYFPSQIPDYNRLKATNWQENNKEWLGYVETGFKWAAAIVAIVGTGGWGAAAATYIIADGAYSAVTGKTMISGTHLTSEEQKWAMIETVATVSGAGMGKLGRIFEGRKMTKLAAVANVASKSDEAADAAHVMYDVVTKDQSEAIGSVAQYALFKSAGAAVKSIRKSSIRSADDVSLKNNLDNDVADLSSSKSNNLTLKTGSDLSIPKTQNHVDVPASAKSHVDVPTSGVADAELAKVKHTADLNLSTKSTVNVPTNKTADIDLPTVKSHTDMNLSSKTVSNAATAAAVGKVKPGDVDVPKVKGTANPSPSQPTIREIIDQKLKEYGVSWDEFNRLRNTHVTKMTQSEYDMMIDIRNAIPYPKKSTVMQKIMPIEAEVWLFNRKEKATAGGYVARRSDVKNITNIREAVEGLRLDYENSPFVETMIDANGNRVAVRDQNGNLKLKTDAYLRLEYTTDETGYIQIPYGDMEGNLIDTDGNIIKNRSTGEPEKVIDPASGNGFIKSDSDEFLVPEYLHSDRSRLKEGSKLYLNVGGEEVLVGRVNKDGIMEYVEG
ncbi:hypothetical protein [Streptococcus cristatus]|uniref:hypothetical protein n=1 Tax=Streptococcus cristatus TaxID=45634 RepID=UPI000F690222|nr:hypothetical protein [Streptococcus cristatus]RSJ75347.1 hypothetical protein D8797_02255 [Streptococcus cristatus]